MTRTSEKNSRDIFRPIQWTGGLNGSRRILAYDLYEPKSAACSARNQRELFQIFCQGTTRQRR